MDAIVRLTQEIGKLWNAVRKLQVTGFQRPAWLAAALQNAGSWQGQAHSTTAKTLIDLSAVFGTPANIKAVLLRLLVEDSGAGAGDAWILVSPNATAGSGVGLRCPPANDRWADGSVWVTCDANGDIYYQIQATGASTLDAYMEVWAYFL